MKFTTVTLAVLAIAAGASADTITMFTASSKYAIGEIGLALCPTPGACNQSLSNATASFFFTPDPGGDLYTITAADPAFAAIAGYLGMSDQEILQDAPGEAIVPFFWNSGPNPHAPDFFSMSSPNLNYYLGHFGLARCVIGGINQTCGYPIAGREIDALAIRVSSGGVLQWQAEGVDLVPEPGPFSLLLPLGLLFLSRRLRIHFMPNRNPHVDEETLSWAGAYADVAARAPGAGAHANHSQPAAAGRSDGQPAAVVFD